MKRAKKSVDGDYDDDDEYEDDEEFVGSAGPDTFKSIKRSKAEEDEDIEGCSRHLKLIKGRFDANPEKWTEYITDLKIASPKCLAGLILKGDIPTTINVAGQPFYAWLFNPENQNFDLWIQLIEITNNSEMIIQMIIGALSNSVKPINTEIEKGIPYTKLFVKLKQTLKPNEKTVSQILSENKIESIIVSSVKSVDIFKNIVITFSPYFEIENYVRLLHKLFDITNSAQKVLTHDGIRECGDWLLTYKKANINIDSTIDNGYTLLQQYMSLYNIIDKTIDMFSYLTKKGANYNVDNNSRFNILCLYLNLNSRIISLSDIPNEKNDGNVSNLTFFKQMLAKIFSASNVLHVGSSYSIYKNNVLKYNYLETFLKKGPIDYLTEPEARAEDIFDKFVEATKKGGTFRLIQPNFDRNTLLHFLFQNNTAIHKVIFNRMIRKILNLENTGESLINHQNVVGETPLHILFNKKLNTKIGAVFNDAFEPLTDFPDIELLVDNGANLFIKNTIAADPENPNRNDTLIVTLLKKLDKRPSQILANAYKPLWPKIFTKETSLKDINNSEIFSNPDRCEDYNSHSLEHILDLLYVMPHIISDNLYENIKMCCRNIASDNTDNIIYKWKRKNEAANIIKNKTDSFRKIYAIGMIPENNVFNDPSESLIKTIPPMNRTPENVQGYDQTLKEKYEKRIAQPVAALAAGNIGKAIELPADIWKKIANFDLYNKLCDPNTKLTNREFQKVKGFAASLGIIVDEDSTDPYNNNANKLRYCNAINTFLNSKPQSGEIEKVDTKADRIHSAVLDSLHQLIRDNNIIVEPNIMNDPVALLKSIGKLKTIPPRADE